MRPYKAVIFDVDGTLIDTGAAILNSLSATLAEMGIVLREEDLVHSFGMPGKVYLASLGIQDVDGALHRWDEHYLRVHDGIEAFDGVEVVIEELKQRGIPIAVVTSKTRAEWSHAHEAFPCLRGFDAVVVADDTARHKPEPEPMLLALDRLGVSADEAVYVGDTVHDMRCAAGAGVDGALALWGCRNPEEITATHTLARPADILALV